MLKTHVLQEASLMLHWPRNNTSMQALFLSKPASESALNISLHSLRCKTVFRHPQRLRGRKAKTKSRKDFWKFIAIIHCFHVSPLGRSRQQSIDHLEQLSLTFFTPRHLLITNQDAVFSKMLTASVGIAQHQSQPIVFKKGWGLESNQSSGGQTVVGAYKCPQ